MNEGKKILILGNGFDLAHRLPTKYSDFLEFCMMIERIHYESQNKGFTQYKFDEIIISNWEVDSVKKRIIKNLKEILFEEKILENDYRRYTGYRRHTIVSNDTIVKEIYKYLDGNIWYRYFVKIYNNKKIKGENWIDFESEISYIVQFLDKNENNLSNSIKNIYKNFESCATSNNKLYYFYNELRINFFDYKKTFKKNVLRKVGVTVKDLREKCFCDLERLCVALEIYLANFVEEIEIGVKLNEIKKINPDYVINFNYTNIYKKLYGKDEEIFYIHGKCNKNGNIEKNNMVLGIDEYWSEQECDKHTNYTIFKKFAQRIRKKTGVKNYRFLEEINDIFKESGAVWPVNDDKYVMHSIGTTKVYVFGHSLDITDKDILKDFFDNEATAVTIYCKDKGTEGELIANVIKLIGEECLLKKANQVPPKIEFKILKNANKENNYTY